MLDYPYFKKYNKIIAIGLSKQQTLHTDPKAIQQTNFTGNLDQPGNATMFSTNEKAKKAILDFSQGTVTVLQIYFDLK